MKRLLSTVRPLCYWSLIYTVACALVALALVNARHPTFLINWAGTIWWLAPGYLAIGFMLWLFTFAVYGTSPATRGSSADSSDSPMGFQDTDSHGFNSHGEPTRNGISMITGDPVGLERNPWE